MFHQTPIHLLIEYVCCRQTLFLTFRYPLTIAAMERWTAAQTLRVFVLQCGAVRVLRPHATLSHQWPPSSLPTRIYLLTVAQPGTGRWESTSCKQPTYRSLSHGEGAVVVYLQGAHALGYPCERHHYVHECSFILHPRATRPAPSHPYSEEKLHPERP